MAYQKPLLYPYQLIKMFFESTELYKAFKGLQN